MCPNWWPIYTCLLRSRYLGSTRNLTTKILKSDILGDFQKNEKRHISKRKISVTVFLHFSWPYSWYTLFFYRPCFHRNICWSKSLVLKIFLKVKQAGAELCQAQHSLSYLHTSIDLATPLLGMLIQPAVDGAGIMSELQLRIYWQRGVNELLDTA